MIFTAKQLRKFTSLRWLHPHSLSGVVVFLLGLSITTSSIFGNFYLVNSNILQIYLLACALNCIFGASILQGPPDVQLGFKYGICLQLCLCYICFRLRPEQLHFSWKLVELAYFDKAVAIALLMMVVYTIIGGVKTLITGKDLFGNKTERKMAGILLLGGFGILLMSLYPLQLAFEGENWLKCVTKVYPYQRQGFSGYVYVPTTWAISMIFFAVTLQVRKIITVNQLVFCGIGSVIGILIFTVIMQEYHIPFISTQKLFIPCGQSEESSWSSWANEALDFSAGAQKLWGMILGRPLSYPIWYKSEL